MRDMLTFCLLMLPLLAGSWNPWFGNAGPELRTLWRIGLLDHDSRGLALAPSGWSRYSGPPVYVVGESTPERDWPYVLPGPVDAWAGGMPQTASVVFQITHLGAKPDETTARLVLDLVDTHSAAPPILKVRVNGFESEHALPGGAGDDSLNGSPEKGRNHRLVVDMPESRLRVGTNLVEISNEAGSWLVWDSLALEASPDVRLGSTPREASAISKIRPIRGLVSQGEEFAQPIEVEMWRRGPTVEGEIVAGVRSSRAQMKAGHSVLRVLVPAVAKETTQEVKIRVADTAFDVRVLLEPVRKLELFVLNHSHVDIGFTDTQEEIAKKQVRNLIEALRLIQSTKARPEGARFVWNAEVAWTLENAQRRLPESQRLELDEAIRAGSVSIEALYLNLLTGLCTPEELLESTRFARSEARRLGVPLDSAMISDVPGFTWGLVDALAEAGIRYLSAGHNRGYTYLDNRAYWWVSQSGKHRLLVWAPEGGYDLCSLIGRLDAGFLSGLQGRLDADAYPYDMAYIRWNGAGDNAAPDRSATDFAQEWNSTYAWPKLVVTTTSQAFRAFEQAYGSRVPELHAEFTPIWEDGAGSTARETALNRNTASTISQATTLAAMRGRSLDPDDLAAAWNKTMLFSEHTWGSVMSISDPEHPQSVAQWEEKSGYAREAAQMAEGLLESALSSDSKAEDWAVLNSSSWPRTEVVFLSEDRSQGGDRVIGAAGQPTPSQRMSDGRLAFLARDVPATGSRKYRVVSGEAFSSKDLKIQGTKLSNETIEVAVDPSTGSISELKLAGSSKNLVAAGSRGLQDYLYLPGKAAPEDARFAEAARVELVEQGPLVATIRATSNAPGIERLVREVTLMAGEDRVRLSTWMDKTRAPATPGDKSYYADSSKEAVHIDFPFDVESPRVWLDRPFSALEPGVDAMPDGHLNWFTVGKWAEVQGENSGVTLATPDTPLIQMGGITNPLGAPWLHKLETSSRLTIWAMNNYWATNYKAYQEGPVELRFSIRPHGASNLAAAARFGAEVAEPLRVGRASNESEVPLLEISDPDVLLLSARRCSEGQYLVRLFGASGESRVVQIELHGKRPSRIVRADLDGRPLGPVSEPITVDGWEMVSLLLEE